MSKQVVTYAKLHTEAFAKDIGSFGMTLPPTARTLKRFVMTRTEIGGILIEVESDKGIKALVEVPAGNIAIMMLALPTPEEAPNGKTANRKS